jgi:hypothetical protein
MFAGKYGTASKLLNIPRRRIVKVWFMLRFCERDIGHPVSRFASMKSVLFVSIEGHRFAFLEFGCVVTAKCQLSISHWMISDGVNLDSVRRDRRTQLYSVTGCGNATVRS